MTAASGLEAAARAKQAVRERVWARLERERAARFPGAQGRIPSFAGASAAAARLASLPPWRAARALKANPTPPSSRSGPEPWPTPSSWTWPSPAWPTNDPSSCSTRRGWRSALARRLHRRFDTGRAADRRGRAATRGPGGLRQRGRQPRGRPGGRQRFAGWIAGLGTSSGHRLVVGHWPGSPYGPVTDVMAEDPAGHRTLYAPTPELAAFLAAAYRFDDVRVAPCGTCRSRATWTVEAGPLRLSFTVGRRRPLGWLLRSVPAPLARTTWWLGLLDLPARRLLPGVHTRGRTRDGRRQWYGARDLHPIVAAEATLDGHHLDLLRPVQPRSGSASARCRAGPPWSTSPPRSRLPVLRMAATLPKECPAWLDAGSWRRPISSSKHPPPANVPRRDREHARDVVDKPI